LFLGSSPDADILVLISEVGSAVEVETVNRVGGRAEVVLGATLRGKILVVTAVLGDLLKHYQTFVTLQ